MAAMNDTLAADLGRLADRLRASTVHVRGRGPGGGSGVIWSPDGLIVTNAHVARGSGAVVEIDGRTYPAELISRDERRDLATLQIEASNLPAAPIGDSDALRVGQVVIAAGNPLGMTGAVSTGIIHAIAPGRPSWVRADIRLLPGNSGGPLADARGQVIGINSMVAGGLGLAVPSNSVRRFLGGRVNLGITARPVSIPLGGRDGIGLLILEVAGGSAAAGAGITLGDVLVGVDGNSFRTPADVRAVDWRAPHELEVLRGGRTLRLVVTEVGQAAA
jgi:serine protease Do